MTTCITDRPFIIIVRFLFDRRIMRPTAIRSAKLALGLAAALAGCRQEEAPPPIPRTVLVQTVTEAPNQGSALTGEIRARHEADLSFRVGGRLIARHVDVGSTVRAGQPLARLDPADLQLAADAARAQLAAAESDAATTAAERERYAGLLARKFVSQTAFDARDNAASAARARLDQARAQSRIAGNQAAYGTLSSEFPAVVTAVLADAGQVVAAGQPVLRVARPEEKEVAVAVPENRVDELRSAKTLAVYLWAQPESALRGELRELAPAADPATRTYAARIRLIDPPPAVRLGMSARVSLDGAAPGQLRVPLAAVVDPGDGARVWVVADGRAQPRPVRVAAFREDGALIAEGVQPGEQVVVAGLGRLTPGLAVTPQPATPPDRQR